MKKAGKKVFVKNVFIPNLIWNFLSSIQACIFRPSSPRSFGMRGIGAAPHLYSALQTCGMTKCVARGFTLIELLVFVLIIGILAAVALPQYQKAVNKAKLSEGILSMSALGRAQQVYYLAHGDYASNLSELDISVDLEVLSRNWTGIKLDRSSDRPQMEMRPIFLPPKIFIIYQLDENTLYCSQSQTAKSERVCQRYFGNTEAVLDPSNTNYDMYKIQ